ncbi:tat (twin-arginine translocation) pathway signal sequence [Variovorax sp. RHLX14]|uniref:tat (twin-arginine translocation) pathway signal sequence n=1 Tax=Variovorax sp. RHLX14 TaxID=1259731 RepID=UPI003F447ED7
MRFIPVVQAEAPIIPGVREPGLTRRTLLNGTGILFGTLAVGSSLALLAPSTAWALELKTLSQQEGESLLQMGRVLFPHPNLPDAVYALLVKDLDTGAAASAASAKTLKDGIAQLDAGTGGSFLKADPAQRLATVRSLSGKPFFNTVRGKAVTSIYDNEMAFAVFGYPGSAWEKGGYIVRGFQDLAWLPDPSVEASPPPFLG